MSATFDHRCTPGRVAAPPISGSVSPAPAGVASIGGESQSSITTQPNAEGSTMREFRHRKGARARTTAARLLAALAATPLAVGAIGLTPTTLQAQESGRVSGIVTDDAGQPVPQVQVVLVGTRFGALTDQQGRFLIVGVTPGSYQLRAQRIGYRPLTQDLAVTSGQAVTANLRLTGAATVLNQVAVIGYTTQVRRDVSDATAGVTSEELRDQQFATVEEGLRGRIPGVNIIASGEPGRAAEVIIRGQNFFGASTPLYVVDGMYLRQNPALNPDDIESIEVLKDASAAAQYGSQAANGVVVIRTKRGRQGEQNRVELRSYYGSQDVPNRLDMMNARQYAAVAQQAYENAGRAVPTGITEALAGNGPSTDWQDAVFTRGAIQNHNLALSGGTQNANYVVSGGLFNQDGTVIETDFRRWNVRVNSELTRGRFTVGENIALSRYTRQGLVADRLTGFPLVQVVKMLPTIPVRDPANASGYGYGSSANETFGTNPVGLLERRPQNERSNQVIGSAFAQAQLFYGLKYRLNLGLNYENYNRSEFASVAQIRQGSPNQFAELNEIRNNFTTLLAENLLTWEQAFGENHRVNAVGGLTSYRENADDITAFRRGFSDEQLRTLNAGSDADAANSGFRRQSVLQSSLVRANYTGWDRYLVTASVRRDGSSRFGTNNQYGTFSALSLGWVASEESFFKAIPYVGRVPFLKLRGSTGTLGNQDIRDYATVPTVNNSRQGYNFGNGSVTPGGTILSLANPDLQWQETQTDNIGLDLGMLDNRLTFTVDAYRTDVNRALVQPPLPWSLGIGGDPARLPFTNVGSLRNTGTEFGLTYRYGDQRDTRGFRLNTTGTLTSTRNIVRSLGNGGQPIFDSRSIARTAVGAPIGTFYLVRTAGIFQNQAEIDAHTTTIDGNAVRIQPDAAPGDVRYVDANRDGRINDDDRVAVGNGTPKYSYGLFFDGGWRSLDFGLNLRGAGGFKIFNAVRYETDRGDDPSNFREGYAPWTAENGSRTTPRIVAGPTPNNRFNSDRWLEDGDFLRIQNVTVGWRLPQSLVSRFASGRNVESRIYLNVQNLHTFTDYLNWDPETLGNGQALGRGIDDGRIYPNVRTVSIGLDLNL